MNANISDNIRISTTISIMMADTTTKPQSCSLAGKPVCREPLDAEWLSISDTVIQAILRHMDAGTTRRFYIKTVREDVKDAMKQLEQKIHRAALVQQPEPGSLVN